MEVNEQLYTEREIALVSAGQEAGWAPERVQTLWRREKSLVPALNQMLILQPPTLKPSHYE